MKKKLIYFPLAGSSSLAFRRIQEYFPQDIEVSCWDYPSHGMRINEEAKTDLFGLCDDFCKKLEKNIEGCDEYYLAGHCIGALVAYECCVQLDNEGKKLPQKIIVSGHGAPIATASEHLELLSDDKLIAKLVEDGLTEPSMADIKYRAMVEGLILNPLKSDSRIYDNYKCESVRRISCDISVVAASEDNRFPIGGVSKWADFTSGRLNIIKVEGNHYFPIKEEKRYFSIIADEINNGGNQDE